MFGSFMEVSSSSGWDGCLAPGVVDMGVNWYLNKFVKIYFDWEHAMFGSPVFSSNGRSQTSNDLYWIRTQIYF